MSQLPFVMIVLGLGWLVIGAEWLVRGASRLAARVGISPLVVGLTVVAFGTSAPELAVSVRSALAGQSDIALGNVVGSNVFNILLILGLAAVITPLRVDQQIVRWDVPLVIGVSVVTLLMALDGSIGRTDGLVLLAGIVAYTVLAVVKGRLEKNPAVAAEYEAELGAKKARKSRPVVDVALVLGGLGLLVLGAQWLVDGAVAIARSWGVSEVVVGLTIVAGGTSLPELATSVVAAFRGERDIAVGNVVGSNLFNLLGVLGAAAVTGAAGVGVAPEVLEFDLPVMVLVAVACWPIVSTGHRIDRWEGILFLLGFVAFNAYQVLRAQDSTWLGGFETAMLWFGLPIVVMTLAASVLNARKRPRT